MVEEKEAIERLYNMKNKVDVALMNSKYEKGDWLYDDVQGTSDTLIMAINALEKQIPKKVNLRHIRKYDGYDDGECPNCGMSVSRECDGNDVFCPDCGQKLDWSDEE